jgi:hypothetical protein
VIGGCKGLMRWKTSELFGASRNLIADLSP